MQKLEELIAALEKAEGSDRWLDANIYMLAHGQTMEIFGGNIVSNGHSVIGWLDPSEANVNFTPSGIGEQIPRYTESVDACIAMIEHVLPRAVISLFVGHLTSAKDGSGSRAQVQRGKGRKCPDTGIRWPKLRGECFHAHTPALALLIATLRAKLSQEKNNAE